MSLQLTAERMITFSDGVIAVIITVMVLDLRVPAHGMENLDALRKVLPMLMIYALSFMEVGIYWVNHHYLIDDVKQVSHGLLWANLGFLFTLSLIPFGTAWVGERGLTPFALSLYLVCCALSAISWIVLAVVVRHRTHTSLADSPIKQAISVTLYLGVIPVSYHSVAAAMVMLAAVAVLWLIPPKQILKMTRT
jgi:uncharacterized membrane protein